MSSLNVSAVTAAICIFLPLCLVHMQPFSTLPLYCKHTGNFSRVKETRHSVARVVTGWQGTNELILGHYHLKQQTSCCTTCSLVFIAFTASKCRCFIVLTFIYDERNAGGVKASQTKLAFRSNLKLSLVLASDTEHADAVTHFWLTSAF